MSIHYEDTSVTLHHGDCLDVLRALPDNSVDSVVTDPPYGLEFMGKEWDAPWKQGADVHAEARTRRSDEMADESKRRFIASGVNKYAAGLPFQQWCELWTAECLRVLKPGGHLLAFGGTRTWHRLACAVEDAGFEVRDSIAWLYGCHDDRTEVLTRRGWVNGLDLTEDDDVAQWATDGTISLVRPTARQRYDYDGPLVRFRNADVDQLVTPNHRVYLQTSDRTQADGERRATWSDWQVKQAADVNRWQRMRLPAAGVHDGPGIGGTDYAALLGWVWAEGGFDASGTGVRIYQSSTNQPFVDEIAALMDRLGAHKRYDYAREWKGNPYTSTTWFVSGELANRVRADLPGKTPTYDLLWRMTADEKRALWDAAMKGDGSKAARTFWQKDRGALEWAQALLASIDCRGKVAEDPRGALHWTTRPTVELQARHLADASEDYIGEVWCVTVPSGAFIVRRNGRVSVSGNSGFPKSLDVSKAIDKRPGVGQHPAFAAHLAERREAAGLSRADVSERVVGTRTGACWNWEHHQFPEAKWWPALRDLLDLDDAKWGPVIAEAERQKIGTRTTGIGTGKGSVAIMGDGNRDITANATPAAEQWQGWGTALKPAFEPVVVARKPLVGTVAGNVLTHGTGALNINACRIGTGDDKGGSGSQGGILRLHGCHSVAELEALAEAGMPTPDGRDARATLDRFRANLDVKAGRDAVAQSLGRWPANVVLDDTQAAALDEQTGELSHNPPARWVGGTGTSEGWGNVGKAEPGSVRTGFGDKGGASRFFYVAKAPKSERPNVDGTAHPTVKPLTLMRWLVRLVTPPGGTVLEPFAGSGTTVEACLLEGFRCIAIEKTPEYLPLILARIERANTTRLADEVMRTPDPEAAIAEQLDEPHLFDLFDEEEPA